LGFRRLPDTTSGMLQLRELAHRATVVPVSFQIDYTL
jgi:hypothetical protein